MRATWVAAALIALAGCKLIDQTTFAPTPEAPPTPPAAPRADQRVALLTISYAKPNPDYQDLLRYAVREAETRAPGVQYEVIAMLPAGEDAAQAQSDAAAVMQAILTEGVPASRVQLGLRTVPAGQPREARVYVGRPPDRT